MDDANPLAPGPPEEPAAGAGGPPPDAAEPPGIPWEQRDRLGLAEALVQTIRLSLLRPAEFFARLPPRGATPPPPLGPVGSALVYAILVGVPSIVVGIFWQLLASSFGILAGDAHDALLSLRMSILIACLSPVLIPVGLLLGSLVCHLFLLILGGANMGLVATFRVLCYASAPDLFMVIPLCGSLVGGVWGFVLCILGLQAVHRTTLGRAFGAVALPTVLCCGFFTLTAILTSLLSAVGD
jgi:hypothetical protein